MTLFARKAGLAAMAVVIAGVLAGGTRVEAVPVLYAANGHYYDFVPGVFTWDQALSTAAGQTHLGLTGHLTTFNDLAEHQFVQSTFSSETNKFLGPWFGGQWNGTGSGATGGWSWVTGESFLFTGWRAGEPNHDFGTENATHFLFGEWNDIVNTRSDTSGYLVEFEPVFGAGLTATPEPSSFFLLGLGVCALVAGSRRATKRKSA